MKDVTCRRSTAVWATLLFLVFCVATPVVALQVPEQPARFDALVFSDPAMASDVSTTALKFLSASDHARVGWEAFRSTHGQDWQVHLDRRSGAPLLVEGQGIPWALPQGATVDSIAASLRPFIAEHRSLLLADDAELVLDRDASGVLTDDVWQIAFNRVIGGVPVVGERYVFTVGHGNLISFGSPRWSRIDVNPKPKLSAADAQSRMTAYLGLTPADAFEFIDAPKLEIIPLRAPGTLPLAMSGRFSGPMGAGYTSALVWRVVLRIPGELPTWVARVDAHTGAIRSFVDDNKYARVKGGIYTISDDQVCPDGCEQPNYAMPFANITIGAANQTTTAMGVFNCGVGSVATTTLAGTYFRINDTCGAVSQSLTCTATADLDLSVSAGTDCSVPAGSSAGNTHATRTNFYQLNRAAERARTWLPGNTWLTTQMTANVNVNSTCNAVWDGVSTNMFKSGGGCNNTGELAPVLLHEWGHGLDQNDGGDFDNPTEAYADVTAFMSTHASCIGRGFRQSGSNCGGYGDACLNCSGVRDQDFDKHVGHTPATPAGFSATHCGTGNDGPCGGEGHCESYISGQAMWDLANRDLPAMGLDPNSSWQVAEKLWYKSRLGSGGSAYNCALPDSDGCSSTSWFSKLRAVDDDDGNLANGTPHAAAIFAAFSRHAIACGTEFDASNQNSTICPALAAPALLGSPGAASSALSWTSVPSAATYKILRNDIGCASAFTRLAVFSGNSYSDLGVANAFPLYYTLQAIGANAACEGPMSACVTVTPQPLAGTIKLDAGSYGCASSVITVTVNDPSFPGPPTANIVSTTEVAPEPVPLVRINATTYRGTITTTASPATHEGLLSIRNNDSITATYVDANDGAGGLNIPRNVVATATCVGASALPVADGIFGTAMKGSRGNGAGSVINVTWDASSCVSPDNHVIYGDLASIASLTVTGAACNLGTYGNASWTGVPAGDLWFVVVGDDNGTTEGSWGTDGGAQRGGVTASGQCGVTSRDNSGVCP